MLHPACPPDGKFIATELVDDGSISVYELSGKSQLRRLTLEGVNAQPVWSPDGKRIAYRSNRAGTIGVFVQSADGSGAAEQITSTRTGQDYPFAWSPDGDYIIFVRENRLWTVALRGDRKVAPLTDAQATTQMNAALSPDGRWVAYASSPTRPGGLRIYLQQFPSGPKYQVSRELANAPCGPAMGGGSFTTSPTTGDSCRFACRPSHRSPRTNRSPFRST